MPATDNYDAAEVCARLEPWLSDRYGSAVHVTSLTAPGTSGFSSETMLVDCEVEGRTERLVVRGEPIEFRVFPTYDLEAQFRCMEAVRAHSSVPVPQVRWFESDREVLGRHFYVMDRIEGEAPPDNVPYTIYGFLFDATPEEQWALYESSIDLLADLHAINVDAAGLRFLDRVEDGPTGLDQQLTYYERYIDYATGGVHHPTLQAAYEWLRANQPSGLVEGLSWGDSRLGNILYRDFRPVAVLDWEMAYLGPREQDVAWFLYFVRFFSDVLELPNLPGFPDEQAGIVRYQERAHYELQHLDWFMAWAAFRYAVIMVRLLHRPGVLEGTPEDWTLHANPMTRVLAELVGLPAPEPGP